MPVMLERWNDDKMDALDSKVDALDTKVNALEARVTSVDAKVDDLARRMENGFERVDAGCGSSGRELREQRKETKAAPSNASTACWSSSAAWRSLP